MMYWGLSLGLSTHVLLLCSAQALPFTASAVPSLHLTTTTAELTSGMATVVPRRWFWFLSSKYFFSFHQNENSSQSPSRFP